MTDHSDWTEQVEQISAPAIVFPGQEQDPTSAHRASFDLLARRAPVEALALIEPALELDAGNYGLRSLRAWAYLLRAQLQRAEEELRGLVEENPSDDWARHALARSLERQSRFGDALPHARLAAAMTGDPEHELTALRIERRLAEQRGTVDDLV
ncbi:tetratricopeptide repeat protein [Nocardioides zeae]|uniref:Tetratricopeptide repeat protein n=1 Tax=Nocardioides zeae TaxID=1457234 RepID=A0A6P0HDN8_9ACTN|nr:tetratricopeptide repeat protein [Nocardioides zeae]NEN76929.1 tetratricopeptide repeat protein [Nocardioides zeae]